MMYTLGVFRNTYIYNIYIYIQIVYEMQSVNLFDFSMFVLAGSHSSGS